MFSRANSSRCMPESQPLYPSDAVTDEGLEARIAELIREAVLEGVEDELPHSIAVTIDDMSEREDRDMLDIYANLFVERDSQKGIIIGHKGERLRMSAPARAPRSRRSSASRCSFRCGSRWPRTGSATPSSSVASASSQGSVSARRYIGRMISVRISIDSPAPRPLALRHVQPG